MIHNYSIELHTTDKEIIEFRTAAKNVYDISIQTHERNSFHNSDDHYLIVFKLDTTDKRTYGGVEQDN
jgi:hypothetical protein